MRTCTIVVNDNRTLTLTVTAVSNNIDVLGFGLEPLEIDWSWTAAPQATAITTATYEARYDKDDAFGSGPINVTGTVTNPGTTGTVAATFNIDQSVLTAGRTYANVITISDTDGDTKTWTGVERALP